MQLPVTASGWHWRIWNLSWPVILSNLSVPLVGIVDTAVMGHMPDPAYVGAVATGAVVFSVLYWGAGFLRMGTTGLVAQAYGADAVATIGAIVARAAGVALALGATLVLVQGPLQWLLFSVWPASAEVEALAKVYFQVRIWGAPLIMLQLVASGVLFGLQRPVLTLLLLGVTNLTNIVLNVVLVVGLGWGVFGLALATLVSEALGGLLGVALIVRVLAQCRVGWPSWASVMSAAGLRKLGQVSGDLIIRSLALQFAFLLFTANGARFGDVILAANAVLMQFFSLLAFSLDGFAHAAEALTGAAWGARARHELNAAVYYTLLWGGVFAVLIAGLLALFGAVGIGLLTDLVAVRTTAVEFLPWVVIMPVVAVWAFLLDGIYIGTTRTRDMRNGMLVSFGVFLGLLGVLVAPLGNHGLWLALVVFMAVRGVTLGARWPHHLRSLPPAGKPSGIP